MTWEVIAPVAAVLGGSVTYLIKRFIDWRVDLALAGTLESIRTIQSKRVDALIGLQAGLAELRHYMNHVANSHFEYSAKCKAICAELRHSARAHIAVIGESLVEDIRLATDEALAYVELPDPARLQSWQHRLDHAFDGAKNEFKTIGQPSRHLPVGSQRHAEPPRLKRDR